MSLLTTGQYYYNYAIPTNAPFGKWGVQVRSVSAGGNITINKSSFFVLPWNTIEQIRRQAGLSSEKGISDDDLAQIAWDSYKEILDDIFYYCDEEHLSCSCGISGTCGNCGTENIDGSNKDFHTQHRPIADHDGDGKVTGEDGTVCEPDITGYWINNSCSCLTAYITVVNAKCGDIQITQIDGSAIPGNAKGVYLSYWTEHESFNTHLLKKATTYLATYEAAVQFADLGHATQADLQRVQNQNYRRDHLNRLERKYKKIRNLIGVPRMAGVH